MDNSVFISYRRNVSAFIARAVFLELRANGVDAFMDVESLNSGQFDTIILNQIAARPYFLLLLTPGTLERCPEPGDWLLREIDYALQCNRAIIPLVTPNFSFADCEKYLSDPLRTELPRYNALNLPHEYFEAAMEKLRTRFLKPLELPTTPTPKADLPEVKRLLKQASAEPPVTEQQLSAQDYFERALKINAAENPTLVIADLSKALALDPQFTEAYFYRGKANEIAGNRIDAALDYERVLKVDHNHEDSGKMREYITKWGRW